MGQEPHHKSRVSQLRIIMALAELKPIKGSQSSERLTLDARGVPYENGWLIATPAIHTKKWLTTQTKNFQNSQF